MRNDKAQTVDDWVLSLPEATREALAEELSQLSQIANEYLSRLALDAREPIAGNSPPERDSAHEAANLRSGIESALLSANHRWSEWGERAEAVENILLQTLAEAATRA